MIEQTLNKSMKQKGPNRWPRLVLRTADAYGISKNTDKYDSTSGLNTAIYGNFL